MSPFGDDFFDDDPFEDMIKKALFGSVGRSRKSSSGNVVQGEKEERVIDYIEEENEVYFVFEFPGFDEEDIQVNLKGDSLKVDVSKNNFSNVKSYLRNKLSQNISYTKKIPVKVKKDFEKSFKNGILEVRFNRK
jgi:HSP20 family molecular chaperone IbpA